jgi:hypothetical protein
MGASSVKSSFEIHEVVLLTGFSKHMLDYLAREDIYRPSVREKHERGYRRLYSYSDVVLLRALKMICTGRGKIKFLKESLREFRQRFGEIKPGQRLQDSLFLVGNRLHTYAPKEGARELVTGQLTLSFVVDLAAISRAVASCVVVGPGPDHFRLTPEVEAAAEEERQRVWGPIRARREAGSR